MLEHVPLAVDSRAEQIRDTPEAARQLTIVEVQVKSFLVNDPQTEPV